MKYLECITCDKFFEHGDFFLAHINNEEIIDCSQCMKCVDRIGANNKPEKNGGWAVLERVYDKYLIKN